MWLFNCCYKKKIPKSGYIYIIKSQHPCLKIGRTKERNTEIAVRKYLYKRYRVSLGTDLTIYLFKVSNTFTAEKSIHKELRFFRQARTELFKTSSGYAVGVATRLFGRHPNYMNSYNKISDIEN